MKNLASALFVLASVLGVSSGCGSGNPGAPANDTPVYYHSDAVVVLDRYCNNCHVAGGIAPFALTDYQSASGHAQAIKSYVSSGLMPPWMPADTGMPLRYSREMRPQDKALLLSWIDQGAKEGDPKAPRRTDIPAAETVAPPKPDVVLDTGYMYHPNTQLTDDYHCFVVDPKLTQDTYFAAGAVTPGNAAIVHHVIVYEIPQSGAQQILTMNGGSANGPGYTCFGGAGGSGNESPVLLWAPGAPNYRAPAGMALRVHAGSLLVIQVHYNMLNYNGMPDQTKAVLELNQGVPKQVAVFFPIADPKHLNIPAGNANAQQKIDVSMALVLGYLKQPSLTIYASAPHMHLLGKRIVTRLINVSTKVLVEVPRWDFHWQGGYDFQTPVVVTAKDTLELECDYDNSAANQPVINGQRQIPRDVTWGESTTDEMCLNFFEVALDPATPL